MEAEEGHEHHVSVLALGVGSGAGAGPGAELTFVSFATSYPLACVP